MSIVLVLYYFERAFVSTIISAYNTYDRDIDSFKGNIDKTEILQYGSNQLYI